MRGRLGALLMALTLGLTGGVVTTTVSATAAQAGTFSCGAKYFIKSAAVDLYWTAAEFDFLTANRTGKGWYEQFTVCRDSSWSPQFFVLKSEAVSAKYGQDSYLIRHPGGVLKWEPSTLTGNHLYEWRRESGSPYYGLVHAETGQYLTVDYPGGAVYPGVEYLGWSQALYREP
ncbi:hypothetical protein BG844_24245 [Couchioplanes caeruleus subsp. caeruleus]|uniref:Uncharacterized protein n=1 Tax=Couchioplanes caeruleus subsp. caeruleus TaxID=56427 RepID=A0A1K0GHT9_9ACTN|nr:hypothetical protein BG844_24245 [Couchioplanes caeruleus subsp. caeruleus]